jgi:lipoprotein-releasing system permease protein
MGYSAGEVEVLFLFQGLLLGSAGAALGLLCGYTACRFLQTLSFPGPPGSTKVDHLHIALSPRIYLQAVALALGASGIAAFLPARAAGRLTPIEIIRAGD